jgi:hypothetical protein
MVQGGKPGADPFDQSYGFGFLPTGIANGVVLHTPAIGKPTVIAPDHVIVDFQSQGSGIAGTVETKVFGKQRGVHNHQHYRCGEHPVNRHFLFLAGKEQSGIRFLDTSDSPGFQLFFNCKSCGTRISAHLSIRFAIPFRSLDTDRHGVFAKIGRGTFRPSLPPACPKGKNKEATWIRKSQHH